MTRYPMEALLDAIAAPTIAAAAQRIGVSAASLHHHRTTGLSADTADRYAIAAGLHPVLVWGWAWVDDALSVVDRMFLDRGWRQAWLHAEAMAA